MPTYVTACPRNCYSTCSMRVTVEDGRIVRIESHPDNRATPEGVCLKGLAYAERAVSPDRILHPLRRNGRGGFDPVPWEEALSEIAERIRRYGADPGPQSVLYYAGSGTKGLLNEAGPAFWRMTGGYTTTYGDLCWPAGLEATRLTLGDNRHSAPWDMENAKAIVLWGKNAAETNIHQMVFVERALAKGARLVVIDPRRTVTAERAELLVQPRPGTDGALALAVGRELIERERVDREFVARHVHGFDAYREAVREWTAERAEETTGVPARHIRRLAEIVGSIRPLTISAGYGMQRYTNSGRTMRSILALLAITGNIGRPGAGWMYANLQTHVFGGPKDPVACYPPEKPDGVVRVSISTARLGSDMLAQEDPPLRMAWVERGNPVCQNPETNRVIEAFRALEFRVVVDQFLTDTAREADLVLPAKTLFEQSDVIGAYWHPYIQRKRKIAEPPGEVKPETEIYRLLADRLSLPRDDVDRAIPGPDDEAIDAWLEARLAPLGLDLARFAGGPVLAPGAEEVAFADSRFPTPSGRIELLSREAEERWGAAALPDYREPEESVRRAPAGDRIYPLHFLTPNTKNRIHSQFNNLAMIRAHSPAPFAEVHPDDGRSRGIDDGDRIRIFNDRGALEVEARITNGILRGCVAVANGWWNAEGGGVNFCTLGRETDMGHGAAFHDCLVEMERVSDEE